MEHQSMTPDEYIVQRLQEQQDYHSIKSSKMQARFKRISVTILILSAVIPVVTIWLDVCPVIIKTLITALSGAVSVLSGILTLCKYQEKYIEYRIVSEKLKNLEFYYKTKTPPYNDECAFEKLVTNCEKILNDGNNTWYSLVKNTKEDTYSCTNS